MFRPGIHFVFQPRLKYLFAAILVLGVLIGGVNARLARAATPQSFVVLVGTAGSNNTDLLQFAPGVLKVHQGDSVTWVIQGFHNAHVGAAKPADLVVVAPVDGKPVPQLNPAIAFPFGAKSGDKYTGGEANNGLPLGPDASPVYTLTIDMKAGSTFSVMCDIHPGMAGSVAVVDDTAKIPTPYEVTLQAAAEFGAAVAASSDAYLKAFAASAKMMNSADGKATVQMGNDVGRAATLLFFPYATVIKAGDSVTWKFGDGAIEPHTVTSAQLFDLQEFVPTPQKNGPPIIALGPALAPMTKDGDSVKAGTTFNAGLLIPVPGQLPTFTLKFPEAGVYAYLCHIHPGMNGVIIVTAK
jgi:plastocyanin